MKTLPTIISLVFCMPFLHAEPEVNLEELDLGEQLDPNEKHARGSEEVAIDQDELSADVQQLVIEQTNPTVIELLGEVENIMDEATERLIEYDTGGTTIAAQTEIIEKIHAAAKAKQKSSGCESGDAMLDMMERMMGKQPGQGQKPGQGQNPGQGQGEGNQGGQGQTGESDAANSLHNGNSTGSGVKRRVPKASGSGPVPIPQEYRDAFDAYNRGAKKLTQ